MSLKYIYVVSFFYFILQITCVFSENLKYYGDAGQDRYVNEHFFHNKKNGVFIDIGAHEGICCSNTYFFEKYLEWSGICFEPNPTTYNKLSKNRQCLCLQAAISDTTGKQSFICHECTWVSGLLKKYNPQHYKKWNVKSQLKNVIYVDAFLLNDVLEEHAITHVDLLSIDTEGGELDILKSIDFLKYNIDVVIVENIYNDSQYDEFLCSKGYKLITKLLRDQIYVIQK